jgi:hypothetical protein
VYEILSEGGVAIQGENTDEILGEHIPEPFEPNLLMIQELHQDY